MPSTSGPDSHHLCGAQGNSQWQESPLSHWHRSHLLCYVRLLQKNQGLSGLCYGGWWFNIYTMNNRASTLHTSRYPIIPFFSHTPKMPHSYSWERPSLKIQSLYYYPKPTLWSSLVTAPNTHHFWRLSTIIGSFLFYRTKLYKQFLPSTRNYTTTPL